MELEGENFEINVVVDGTIKCQLFAANAQKNLTLTEVKTSLLDDVAEFIPANYWFLKPIDANTKIPVASKQEKLIVLRKCLIESNGEFSLHLRSYEEKANVRDDEMTSDGKQAQSTTKKKLTEDAVDEQRPRKILKQMTIASAFKGVERSIDPLNVARGRVHLYSTRDIDRASAGRQEYYKFWNAKAQELCSDQTFNSYKKQEIHGIIDTEWKMRSCEILSVRAKEAVQKMSTSKPGATKAINKNITRVKEARRVACEINRQISELRQRLKESGGKAVRSQIVEMEGKLSDAMSEIKLALDALRKSMAKAAQLQTKAAGPVDKDESDTDCEQQQKPSDSSEEFEGMKECDGITLEQQEICDLAHEAKEDDGDW